MAVAEANQGIYSEVHRRVLRDMHHPFLARHQIRQRVSRFHFDVGCAILESAQAPREETLSVLEAVLLLEQSLSIHDEVDDYIAVKRQLLVLAGDYDSSQYYWILSRLDMPSLLDTISDAVVRINEEKMNLTLHTSSLPSKEFLDSQEVIQGSLLRALMEHYIKPSRHGHVLISGVVRAFIINEDLRLPMAKRRFLLRQSNDWIVEAVDACRRVPVTPHMEPIHSLCRGYLKATADLLDKMTLAEEKR